MNTIVKAVVADVLAGVVLGITMIGPVLALSMAYLLWGIKGTLFTLGLLLAK